MKIAMIVNGKPVSREVADNTLLVEYIRDHLRLTGTHVGCDTSQCGACVVHVDGQATKSCTMLAASAEGLAVTTVEGLAKSKDESASDASGVQRKPRPAMRVLYSRYDHERHRYGDTISYAGQRTH